MPAAAVFVATLASGKLINVIRSGAGSDVWVAYTD
jgi:hypothetical protein